MSRGHEKIWHWISIVNWSTLCVGSYVLAIETFCLEPGARQGFPAGKTTRHPHVCIVDEIDTLP